MPDPKNIPFKRLEKKVFTYDSSKADNRYFRVQLMEYIKSGKAQEFTEFLSQCIWVRNAEGTTSKYLYFNEKSQRVYIDRLFLEWANRTMRHIQSEIADYAGKTH